MTLLVYGVHINQGVWVCGWAAGGLTVAKRGFFLWFFWDQLESTSLGTSKNQCCLKISTSTFGFGGAAFAVKCRVGFCEN